MRCRLTPRAIADLEDIWTYTARNWSLDQADRYVEAIERAFDAISAMPEIARERIEFSPPVRIHPSGQHLMIYRIETGHVAVIRILGGRRDWVSILRTIDQG
jgi:toxin ParE1/3/4